MTASDDLRRLGWQAAQRTYGGREGFRLRATSLGLSRQPGCGLIATPHGTVLSA
jgi:hypothetical protein